MCVCVCVWYKIDIYIYIYVCVFIWNLFYNFMYQCKATLQSFKFKDTLFEKLKLDRSITEDRVEAHYKNAPVYQSL